MGQKECTVRYLVGNPSYICGYMMFSRRVKCHRKRSRATQIMISSALQDLRQWTVLWYPHTTAHCLGSLGKLYLFTECSDLPISNLFKHSMSVWLVLYHIVYGGVSLSKWKVTTGISCCNLPGICRPALEISVLLRDPVPRSFKGLSFSITTFPHLNVLNTSYIYNFNLASPQQAKPSLLWLNCAQ